MWACQDFAQTVTFCNGVMTQNSTLPDSNELYMIIVSLYAEVWNLQYESYQYEQKLKQNGCNVL